MSRTHITQVGVADVIPSSDGRLAISVPIQIKHRSGRKLITLPNGEVSQERSYESAPTPLQMALAKCHRWLAMLQSGEVKSLRELADCEGVDNSYISRMVNLTLLAPDIVAAILDDALPKHVTLMDLAVDPPALWDEQRKKVGMTASGQSLLGCRAGWSPHRARSGRSAPKPRTDSSSLQ